MAFSSRFAFWEQKVKEEDKTLPKPGPPGKEEGALAGSSKEGPSKSPQPPTSLIPPETSQRAKSPAPTLTMNGLGAATAEGPSEEAQGLSRKRVANAVRKVVSKVLPGEELGNAKEPPGRGVKSPEHPTRSKKGEKAAPSPKPPPPPPPPPAPPKPEAKKEAAKDELSLGLRSLMSRGRGKEHKPRGKQSSGKGEKPSSQEPGSPDRVDSPEKAGSPAKPETPKKQRSPSPPEELAAPGSAGPKSDLTGEQQSKSPAPGVKQEAGAAKVQLTPVEEAHQRLERIFTASVMSLACLDPEAASPAHSQVGCSSPTQEPSAPSGDHAVPPAYTWAGICARASCWSAKTEEQIAAEEAWNETEKVWLVHRDGFSLASQLKSEELSLPEGKVRVKLDHDGAILDVDEDDVEKANAPSCDRLEDLASLVYLNESSVLHTLRQRYGASLLHTYAGPSLLVLGPRGAPAVYSEKVMHMFKGCRREDMAPHIYAVAQTAYRAMLMSRQDQSIVLLGSSGSGKTTSCQHLVQYLATIAGVSGNKVFSVEKWQALYTLLEAFGNSPTIMNGNATRFSQILSLDFDQAGQVASASIQTMLLEKLRVARRPANEATFNVFYYLLACGDGTLRTELHLNHLAENSVFGIVPLAKPEEKQKAAQQFSKLQVAMKVLGISTDEQKACWLILAAIYHLGAAGATKEAPEEQEGN
ncbi:Unconventional myosin-XVIIIa [Plecturocebus cupreus]